MPSHCPTLFRRRNMGYPRNFARYQNSSLENYFPAHSPIFHHSHGTNISRDDPCSRLTVGSGGGRLGPDFPLLRELEPQLGEQGGVGHAFPPQAGQHSLILTMILAQRLNSTQYLHQCRGSVTFWYRTDPDPRIRTYV
jgi:hypothetical protein